MRTTYETAALNSLRRPLKDSPVELTARQLEVLELLCEGLQNKQIARRLNIASATVKIHVANILRTLEVSSRLQAAIAAINLGVAKRFAPAQQPRPQLIEPSRHPAVWRLVPGEDAPSGMQGARGDWSLEAAAG